MKTSSNILIFADRFNDSNIKSAEQIPKIQKKN